MVLSQTPFTSVWKPLVVCYFLALKSGQGIFRDFWIPKLKKRSLSAPLRGALKTKQPRGERIKLVGGCPFITRAFIWTLGITKLRGRASQRFPFGPWLSLLRRCKQFSKSHSSGPKSASLEVYHYMLLGSWNICTKHNNGSEEELFWVTARLWFFANMKTLKNLDSVEYFAIVRWLFERGSGWQERRCKQSWPFKAGY